MVATALRVLTRSLQKCKPNDGLHCVVENLRVLRPLVLNSISRMTTYTVVNVSAYKVIVSLRYPSQRKGDALTLLGRGVD